MSHLFLFKIIILLYFIETTSPMTLTTSHFFDNLMSYVTFSFLPFFFFSSFFFFSNFFYVVKLDSNNNIDDSYYNNKFLELTMDPQQQNLST
jgi:hypothetical protein